MIFRWLNIALAIWLMASPQVLAFGGPAAINAAVVGPLVLAVAIVCFWEANAILRLVNVALGGWLFIAPLWLPPHTPAPVINSMLVGALTLAFSVFPLRRHGRHGGGWAALLLS